MSDEGAGAACPDPTGRGRAFLNSRRRENVSANTLRAYAATFASSSTTWNRTAEARPAPAARLAGDLYDRNLSPVSMRRKVARYGPFFDSRERGSRRRQPARLLATPKAPGRSLG